MDNFKRGITSLKTGGAAKVKQAQHAATNLKKKLGGQRNFEDEYSEIFQEQREKISQTSRLLEEIEKTAKQYAEIGEQFASVIETLGDILLELSDLSADTSEKEKDQNQSFFTALASHRACLASIFRASISEVQKLLVGYVDQLNREIKDVKSTKKKCYDAYDERESQRVKV